MKVENIILVASDNQKRLEWPLTGVKRVIPGNDGTAKVKTAVGELTQPLQRLLILEGSNENKVDSTAKPRPVTQINDPTILYKRNSI